MSVGLVAVPSTSLASAAETLSTCRNIDFIDSKPRAPPATAFIGRFIGRFISVSERANGGSSRGGGDAGQTELGHQGKPSRVQLPAPHQDHSGPGFQRFSRQMCTPLAELQKLDRKVLSMGSGEVGTTSLGQMV